MAKIEVTPVTSGYNIQALNLTLEAIEDEFKQKVVYRNEASPMEMDLDLNGFGLINVETINGADVAALDDIGSYVGTALEAAESAAVDASIASEAASSASADAISVRNAKLVWRRAWNSGTSYIVNDAVSYAGASYIAVASSVNQPPPNATFWDVLALRGDNGTAGTGTGDASTNTSSSVDNEIALFSGTAGKTIKRAGGTGIVKINNGVMATAVADTDFLKGDVPVTTAKGGTGVNDGSNLAQPGDIKATARPSAPPGWLKANGAAISRTTYSALFGAIGTIYGAGNGSTTFNIPDLRGEFIRGLDDGRGLDAGRTQGSVQGSQFGSHSHSVTGAIPTGGGGPSIYYAEDISNSTFAIGTSAAGGTSNGSETRPRNMALLYCIKY